MTNRYSCVCVRSPISPLILIYKIDFPSSNMSSFLGVWFVWYLGYTVSMSHIESTGRTQYSPATLTRWLTCPLAVVSLTILRTIYTLRNISQKTGATVSNTHSVSRLEGGRVPRYPVIFASLVRYRSTNLSLRCACWRPSRHFLRLFKSFVLEVRAGMFRRGHVNNHVPG